VQIRLWTIVIGVLLFQPWSGAVEVLRNVDEAVLISHLTNGDFERGDLDSAMNWEKYGQGYKRAKGEGRNGSGAIVLEASPSKKELLGAMQTVVLNQKKPAMVIAEGWSKAVNVTGSSDADYSIYMDVIYDDGSPLWGQTGCFECGTHDWEQARVVIFPMKPIRQISFYCLFRNHSGKVWFDDVTCKVASENGIFCQGMWVDEKRIFRTNEMEGRPFTCEKMAGDFSLKIGELPISNSVSGVKLKTGTGAFLVRDVAANSGFYSFRNNECAELGVKLKFEATNDHDAVSISGRLVDTTGKDRALTLLFALPIDAKGWKWWDSIRSSREIIDKNEYINSTRINCGATGVQSLYPVGAISGAGNGLAFGLDMGHPAVYRISYNAGLEQMEMAYDFGLVSDSLRFPSCADFRFVIYAFDAEWGFRSAWEQYMKLFPDYFVVRTKEQGIWMPFTDVSTVQGWQDFGFKFHEGDNARAFDATNGIYAFRYTEPMTWWMPMAKELPRTLDQALKVRDELGRTNSARYPLAAITKATAMWNLRGEPCMEFLDTPWCNGAVWSLNPNPHLPDQPNFATYYWNDRSKKADYGSDPQQALAGEYLDSLEGYVTANLNYRREHFRYTTVPLAFDFKSFKPALFKGLAIYEFTRWFCENVHQLNRLTFANSVPTQYSWFCPWLDVMGTETSWLNGKDYAPMSDAELCFKRTLCGQKPYLFLMNVSYDLFTHEMVEKYFQCSLAYGIFPSMFSHNAADAPYWQNPNWYNRDRDLFKRFIPLIRKISEAGWQPLTWARCNDPVIRVERFGEDKDVYFTLYNPDLKPHETVLTLATNLANARLGEVDLVSGRRFDVNGMTWKGTVGGQQAVLLHAQRELH